MNFFGVGAAEAILVFVIALIVVGPQRFPEIMRQAGRWYRIARAYSNEVMKDVRSAVDEIEREVKAESEDFKGFREELKSLNSDLREAREDVKDIHKDTKAAASSPAPITPPAKVAPSSAAANRDEGGTS